MKISVITSTLALMLSLSVVLNGAHAKDIMTIHNLPIGVDQAAQKALGDMHPHVDKQLHKMSVDMPQLDGRSLRLRDYKRLQLNKVRDLLDAWRNQLSMYLG